MEKSKRNDVFQEEINDFIFLDIIPKTKDGGMSNEPDDFRKNKAYPVSAVVLYFVR